MKLQVRNLTISIEKHLLFSDLSFDAASGQLLGLVGPSGCGKTTLLNTLGLILPVHSGSICYDGVEATRWPQRRISAFWRHHASFVIQDAGIDDDENLLYNVTLKKPLRKRKETHDRALQALTQVGLAERANDTARVLSGGEQRRVAIARSIYRQSSIIFADEPTASLDEDNRALVESLLLREAQRGALVIVSTHDMSLAQHCTSLIDLGTETHGTPTGTGAPTKPR